MMVLPKCLKFLVCQKIARGAPIKKPFKILLSLTIQINFTLLFKSLMNNRFYFFTFDYIVSFVLIIIPVILSN